MFISRALCLFSLWLAGCCHCAFGGNVILQWNDLMLDAIRHDNTAPTLSSRNLAILHTAIFDSVNSVTRAYQPYSYLLPLSGDTSAEAAATGAASVVMKSLYPSYTAKVEALFQSWLAETQPGRAIDRGIELGSEIGLLTIESRIDDGAATEVTYVPSNQPGQWQRTPPLFRPPLTPHWRYVVPFCLPGIEKFAPIPPPAIGSAEYANAVDEVRRLGGKVSSERTPEQTLIAQFWSDFSYTAMPPGHWHEITASIVEERNNTLEESARLFALVSLAQADAAIVCWDAKFRYNLWRPIAAIQRADEDGNPLTQKDAAWDHFLAAPPFPAYTSGHSTFSKASATVLATFFGTDNIHFTATSDSVPGVVRSYSSLAACADEIGMSRIYGGIHYQFDNQEGKRTGHMIAEYVCANFLLPNTALPVVRFMGFEDNSPVVMLHGIIGESYRLEATTDLKIWRDVSTHIAPVGGTKIKVYSERSAPFEFYRAVKVFSVPSRQAKVIN